MPLDADLEKELNKIMKETTAPSILICGQTGAGKSSIINYIFQKDVANINHAEPCTQKITKYDGEQIKIYDSKGYEIGSTAEGEYEKEIFQDFLNERKNLQANDPRTIHLVWYVISGIGKRVTNCDISIIKKVNENNFPIAVLLSKIDEMDDEQFSTMKTTIKKEIPEVPLFCLSIKDKNFQELKKYTEWEKLKKWSYDQLPKVCRTRFLSSLKEAAELKYNHCIYAIGTATATATATGATPIPFSDAAILVPVQTAMVTYILTTYGVSIGESAIKAFVGSTAISAIGKSVAGNLIKLIPGLGSLIGGVINGSVAGAITFGIGTALNKFLYNYEIKRADGVQNNINLNDLFSDGDFLNQIKQYSKEYKK